MSRPWGFGLFIDSYFHHEFRERVRRVQTRSLHPSDFCFQSEQLNDAQKPFMAQTIARLFIKLKKFHEAEEWASKAIGLRKTYTLLDTRGQVYKNRLREQLKNDEETSLRLRRALVTAILAVADFQKSESLMHESMEKAKSKQDLDIG